MSATDAPAPESSAPYGRDKETGVPLTKDGKPAPYGVRKDGTAARRRGRRPGEGFPGRKTTQSSKAKPTSSRRTEDREKAAKHLGGILRKGLGNLSDLLYFGADKSPGDQGWRVPFTQIRFRLPFLNWTEDAVLADALVIESAGPEIAEALGRVAADNPRMARWITRLEDANEQSDWVRLGLALGVAVKQIAANHGRIPATEETGCAPASYLADIARQRRQERRQALEDAIAAEAAANPAQNGAQAA